MGESSVDVPHANVHHLPCAFSYSGPASVSLYWLPSWSNPLTSLPRNNNNNNNNTNNDGKKELTSVINNATGETKENSKNVEHIHHSRKRWSKSEDEEWWKGEGAIGVSRLRGRELKGKRIRLSGDTGYIGHVYRSSVGRLLIGPVQPHLTFTTIHYWRPDFVPDVHQPLHRALHWTCLAPLIHSPVLLPLTPVLPSIND